MKHNCNCDAGGEQKQQSLADLIRANLLRSGRLDRDPSSCCITLYMQSSKHRTYGMLIRTCSKNIDQDSLDWLWTTCLAKILLTET